MQLLVHLNCANVNLKQENLKMARLWSGYVCTLRKLPLYHQDLLPMNRKAVEVDNYINIHVIKLQELKTHISICHLNTQSMTSTFDVFQFEIRHHHPFQNMVKEWQTSFRICQFTWLQILLQEQRWEKRWWCRRIYKRLYYIQN